MDRYLIRKQPDKDGSTKSFSDESLLKRAKISNDDDDTLNRQFIPMQQKNHRFHPVLSVPGFYMVTDFISEEEEREILKELDGNEDYWERNQSDKTRRIQIYGPTVEEIYRTLSRSPISDDARIDSKSTYLSSSSLLSSSLSLSSESHRNDNNEGDNNIQLHLTQVKSSKSLSEEQQQRDADKRNQEKRKRLLPSFAQKICNRIVSDVDSMGMFPGLGTYRLGEMKFTGLFINEYLKQDRLRFHFDNRQVFKELLFGLSMGCDCIFSMKKGTNVENILLPARSLYVMSGDARYKYQHGILLNNILGDRRVSITIRGMK